MEDFKILLKAIVDAKDTQAQLNAIKNLSVKIEKLNLGQSAINEFRNQLSKNGIDVNLVLGNTNQLQNRAKQTGQQIGKLVSDSAEKAIGGVSSKGIDRYFRIDPSTSREFENEMKQLVSQWTNAKGEMTDLKIDTRTVYDKEADASFERLHQATVTYKNDLDEVTKKTIAWRQVGTTTDTKGNEVAIRGFVEVAGQYSKALEKASIAADTFADKQTKLKSSLSDSLNSIKSSVADQNVSKSIKDQANISSLQSQYQIVEQAISNVGSASKSNFAQMEADARTQISVLNDMVRQYRNAENVATSLRTKDFSTVKEVQVQNLQAFKDKIEGSNVPIAKIQTELNNLDAALNNAFDAESLTSFLNQMDVVQAKFKQMSTEITSANRNEKVGINVSGLESKIIDIQRISPEINNFKTQINGAEVSVESLLEDLSKVNSQGDFSVVNTKFKAFTDSAKAAGIAVTELATNSKKNDKIQLSIGNGDFETKILGYETALKKLGLSSEEITLKMKGVNSAYDELKNSANGGNIISDDVIAKAVTLNTEMSKLSNITRQIKLKESLNADQLQVDQTVVRLTEQIRVNTNYTKESKTQIRAWLDELAKGNVAEARLKQINSEAKQLHANMASLNKVGFSWTDKLKNAWSKFGGWSFATGTFMALFNQLRQIPREVIKVNSSIIELTKVSDSSSKEIAAYFDEAAESSKRLGSSISGIIDTTADWSRLGYNLQDSKQLAEIATLYKNVGDGIDIDTANKSLISTLQGFQLEANDALGIIDRFNEVANNFPIDSAGIGEALQRSAASFYAANTDLSKSIALITGTNSVVQDPTSVGTMWKTVSMRIRGAVTELEEAGEDTDGLITSTAQLQSLVKGLTGFDIMKDKDTFKDIYDIVVGIGHEWKNLSDIEQASLLEALAGKRQGNALSAALNNIGMIEEAYKTAENSAGSALREQEKYEKGIQYSLNRLSASFQEFSNHIFNSDTLKGIVDFGNSFVNVLDSITEKGLILPTIFGGVGITAFIKNLDYRKVLKIA